MGKTIAIKNTAVIIVASVLYYIIWWNVSPFIHRVLDIECRSLRLVIDNVIASVPIIMALLYLHKPRQILLSLGLNSKIMQGFAFAAISVSPMLVGYPLIGHFNHDISPDLFLKQIILASFIEELIFRGFMFGQLYRYGKVGFIWAVMVSAVLFGIGHLYQGHDMMSALMAFGVTFIGGVFFSWIYVRWSYNLWAPIGLHILMNLAWIMFPTEGAHSAVGTVLPNVLRIGSIAIAIIITLLYGRNKLPN